MLTGVAVGLTCFAAFIVAHFVLFHFREVRDRAVVVLAIFVAAMGACFVFSALVVRHGGDLAASRGPLLVASLSGVLLMCALLILYMPFYYTIATSLSVRTLITVQRSPNREISLAVLKAKYVAVDLVRRRLEAMVQSDLLVSDGGGFRLTRKGRLIARVFRLIKIGWKLGPGG